MSAPLPLQGTTNPFTSGYQKRQFNAGLNQSPASLTTVWDALATLTSAQTTSETVNPLEEEADNKVTPQKGII